MICFVLFAVEQTLSLETRVKTFNIFVYLKFINYICNLSLPGKGETFHQCLKSLSQCVYFSYLSYKIIITFM